MMLSRCQIVFLGWVSFTAASCTDPPDRAQLTPGAQNGGVPMVGVAGTDAGDAATAPAVCNTKTGTCSDMQLCAPELKRREHKGTAPEPTLGNIAPGLYYMVSNDIYKPAGTDRVLDDTVFQEQFRITPAVAVDAGGNGEKGIELVGDSVGAVAVGYVNKKGTFYEDDQGMAVTYHCGGGIANWKYSVVSDKMFKIHLNNGEIIATYQWQSEK